MKEKRNFLKRADCRLRLFCHRLTERQRMCLLLAMFLPFFAGCIYAIGTSLHHFGSDEDGGPDIGYIRSLDLRKEKSNEHSIRFYEDGHPENQKAAENSF